MLTLKPFLQTFDLQIFKFRLFGIQLIVLLASCFIASAHAEVDFENEIRPILASHCFECHNPDDEEGGFIVNRENTLGYIEAGDAAGSDLVTEYLTTDDEDMLMPPADYEKPLTDAQITLVKTWINEGAAWPEGVEIEAVAAAGAVNALDADQLDEAAATEEPVVVESEITPQLLKDASGSLHPAAIHLPVGLLLVAGLFAFLSLRGNFVMSDCAYYCLWIGSLSSVIACVTGWFYSPMERKGDVLVLADLLDMDQPVFWHRTGALVLSAAALFISLMAMNTRARDPDDGTLWKLGAIVLAGVVGWVGHLGGELTYGKSHYKELHQVIDLVVPGWNELGKEAADAEPVASPVGAGDASDEEPSKVADDDSVELTL